MKGEWILKEVYFEDGWPSVMRDPRNQTQGKTMTREDIIRMAREANLPSCHTTHPKALERFAALVAAHEREKVAKWMVERGYATGHGDTIEELLTEIDWQAAEREREECAKLCEEVDGRITHYRAPDCAVAIRARVEK